MVNDRVPGHSRERLRVGALALFCLVVDARPAFGLPLQEIITRTEPAVVHVSVSDGRGGEVGTGSGFVVSGDGRVVTNHHVVEDADRVEVVFQGGRKVRALGVLAFDEEADLAVLQLEKGSYPTLALAEAPAKQGDAVVVIGSPRGLSGTVSTGIVSAVRAEGAHLGDDHRKNWTLQLTAAVSPGSSGSPVMNEAAEVVAVTVGQAYGQALNFGVPVDLLRKLLPTATGEPSPFRVLRGGRSLATNLLISAGGLGGAALLIWVTAWILGRKERRARGKGRDVLDPIIKH
jgi:S1-C subfamily serine protease